jgi:List-Bact-rpt repeat protein
MRLAPLAVIAAAVCLSAAATASGAVQIVSQGTKTLTSGQTHELDAGVAPVADLTWEVLSSGTVRRIRALNGATLANMGVKDFGAISSPELSTLSYATTTLFATGANPPLVLNDVFAVKTALGNFAKVKVTSLGTSITFQWVTYPPPVKLAVTKAGSGSGTVKSSPAGIDCGAKCTVLFAKGTDVTITATPDAGSAFSGYEFSCSGTGACSIPMNSDRGLKVTFDIAQAALTVTKIGNGTVTGSPAGIACGATCTANYPSGSQVTLTGAPDPGWLILGWTGGCVAAGATCVLKPTAPTTVNAVFGFAKLRRVAAQARWRKSVLTGSIRVEGDVSSATEATLSLTRGQGRRARTFLKRAIRLPAGAFALPVKLPKTLLPGTYLLVLQGSIAGAPLPKQTVSVNLPAPPEGVVARALISEKRKGKGATTLPVSTRKMFARFIFAPGALPKQRLRAEWVDPAGNAVGTIPTRRRQVVETFVAFPASFPAARKRGVWRCVLKSGNVVVKEVSVRLR